MKWFKVFESKESALNTIPDKGVKLLLLGQRRIALARFDDKIFATADACPHNGESLSKGSINYLGEIICPWHNYRFNIKSGTECQNRTQDLQTFPIECRADGLFIGIPE
ncbi:Rieske (2Fe-2S) protein [Fulvivirga sp. RKSG066]|uniref:Rieske (2Fe-2S) protein n=1 Tax=Fulvivirga aurantia TaxID=2529383 RepID=UPI0012BC652C|nr:Rieske (2Fe-2S) protein [Fulvivirga aurantia]MTI23144.1 Rieske (2Fe-2S) protein [Fulvivirga aurantia]